MTLHKDGDDDNDFADFAPKVERKVKREEVKEKEMPIKKRKSKPAETTNDRDDLIKVLKRFR